MAKMSIEGIICKITIKSKLLHYMHFTFLKATFNKCCQIFY